VVAGTRVAALGDRADGRELWIETDFDFPKLMIYVPGTAYCLPSDGPIGCSVRFAWLVGLPLDKYIVGDTESSRCGLRLR
jgi:hypothetical protein